MSRIILLEKYGKKKEEKNEKTGNPPAEPESQACSSMLGLKGWIFQNLKFSTKGGYGIRFIRSRRSWKRGSSRKGSNAGCAF